jgi:hypothetical protein
MVLHDLLQGELYLFYLLPSGARGNRETLFHFNLLILQTVGSARWTGDQPVARHRKTHTSMPRVGFEPSEKIDLGDFY